MIEKCKVLKWNELNMVIEFKGSEVQIPSVNKADYIYVKLIDGKYILAGKEEYEKSLVKVEKKEYKREANDDK